MGSDGLPVNLRLAIRQFLPADLGTVGPINPPVVLWTWDWQSDNADHGTAGPILFACGTVDLGLAIRQC